MLRQTSDIFLVADWLQQGDEMVAVHFFFAVRWIQAPTKEMNVGISFHGGFLDPASRA